MKKKAYPVWSILYPILLYYVISSFVFFGMNLLFGEAQEIYMLKQMVSSASTIPFLLALRKQDLYVENVVYGKPEGTAGWVLLQGTLVFVSMAALGIAFNNFIAMTPLTDISAGFQNANENFFAGGMLLELLASCLVVPIAEELLFRGVVLKRASILAGERGGILLSSLLFGVIHMNLVQFLYAALLGILLAVFVTKTRRVSMAVVGHAAANLMAVLRAETGILDFSYQPNAAGIGFSLVMVIVGAAAAGVCFRLCSCNGRQIADVSVKP